jgi:hypothetical protein
VQISDFLGGEFSPFCEKYLKKESILSQIPCLKKRKTIARK